jgi:hypothetical protein
MKPLFRIILATLGCALLITAIGVLTPRAVYAQANQDGRPATPIRDQDNPARHPFAAVCVGSSTSQFVSCSTSVPAGQEVVIENGRN